MRVWVGTTVARVAALRDGDRIEDGLIAAESDDEQHEYEALLAAHEDGPVVIVAEVPDGQAGADDASITLDRVEAWYADADDSGDVAWYAPEEIETVLALFA